MRKTALYSAVKFFILFVAINMVTGYGAISLFLQNEIAVNPSVDVNAFANEYIFKYMAEIVGVSSVLSILVVYVFSLVKKVKFKLVIAWGNRLPIKMWVICAIAGISSNVWLDFLIDHLSSTGQLFSSYTEGIAPIQNTSTLIGLFSIMILAPLAEEIFFRGIILSRMTLATNVVFGIITQAILFGSLHTGIIWIIYSVFLGCVLGYIRICTASLWSAISFHIAFNSSSLVFFFIENIFDFSISPLFLFIGGGIVFAISLVYISKYWVKPRGIAV